MTGDTRARISGVDVDVCGREGGIDCHGCRGGLAREVVADDVILYKDAFGGEECRHT